VKHFRNYIGSKFQSQVEKTYHAMHTQQTLSCVLSIKENTRSLKSQHRSVWEIISKLDEIIDYSDPDNDLPQIVHANQTAVFLQQKYMKYPQAIKLVKINTLFSIQEWNQLPTTVLELYHNKTLPQLYPKIKDWGWFPLIGFIHDLGKILVLDNFGKLPQWSVVGDTFPIGCAFSDSNIFYEKKFYTHNPDYKIYQTASGCYKIHCGFEQIHMSYGHNEYLFTVLDQSKSTFSPQAKKAAGYII